VANPFRKKTGWVNFLIVVVISIVLMAVDARTTWLDGPRNVLSVLLSPIQTLASIPASISRFVDNAMDNEPDVKIAYDNLRNEYFQLKAEALLLGALQEENQDLRSLLDATERLQEKVTLAELINVSIDPYNHRVLINRGISNQ